MRYMVVWITYCQSHPNVTHQAFSKRRRQTKSDLLSKQFFNIAKSSRVKLANCCLSRFCTSLLMVSGSESRPGEICSLLTAFKWESQSYRWISWKKVEGESVYYKKALESLVIASDYWVHLRKKWKRKKNYTKLHPKYA